MDAAVESKQKHVKSDLPTGLNWRDKVKGIIYVRIKGVNDKGVRVQINRPIPGLYGTKEKALEAQAAAQEKHDRGEAVWPAPPQSDRNARGQVLAPAHRPATAAPAHFCHHVRQMPTHRCRMNIRRARSAGQETTARLDVRQEEVEPWRAALEEVEGCGRS